MTLRDALVALANDWNRRDKQSREHGGTRIYVADCANELRDEIAAILSAHPATDSAPIGSNSVDDAAVERAARALFEMDDYYSDKDSGWTLDADAYREYASAALDAAWPGMVADAKRLDYIERTFSGMTDRERYLPVRMIWGKGCNGRTLREACDKYMKRDAAMEASRG